MNASLPKFTICLTRLSCYVRCHRVWQQSYGTCNFLEQGMYADEGGRKLTPPASI